MVAKFNPAPLTFMSTPNDDGFTEAKFEKMFRDMLTRDVARLKAALGRQF
jgi:hypothetical protein